jgi:23S rRNA pseudouridine1911/1915/1917 synthase
MRPGGVVRVGYTPLPEEVVDVPIVVLARGEGWLAVDKPAGIPVHPVNRIRENTVIRMLRRQEANESLRLVHRLDRETSGALLVAETAAAARFLSEAFVEGRVAKEYLALVRGETREDRGRIDLPIGEAVRSQVFTRRAAGEGGQPSRTRWRVEARRIGATLLRVFPETGRRHQIRVHLAAIGHPVIGDLLYGRPDGPYLDLVRDGRDARREERVARQMLHCARLAFSSTDGGTVAAEAPLPSDFLAALAGTGS